MAEVIEKKQVIELAMISDRLNSYDDFSQTTKEKIMTTISLSVGLVFEDISTAIAEHAAADTLLSKAKN
ncbi:hypothetical protein [Photobacterium kishitanii]|uniref:hypothetical protein n=1 Tax=Photobacterium kishitanii TaxID=318456 RepID=UPI0027389F8A|nr:hypothetical protein [Photobacterium kishitanii]